MNKIRLRAYSMVLLVLLGIVFFHFFDSVDRPDNVNALPRMQAAQLYNEDGFGYRKAFAAHLTAGICALLLVGYLFWTLIQKSKKDSRAELIVRENSFYRISQATGRTEYDLFHKSAEGWSVSPERIDQDFKKYMTDQVMPHYAKDFVRKNRRDIDKSLIVKRKVKPTSWSDWAIAMLVFPGSVLLLYILMLLFDKQ